MTAAKKKRDAADHLRDEGAEAFRQRVDQDILNHRHDEPNDGPPPPARFQLTRFSKVRLLTKPQYLIKNILPDTGLAVVWGAPKCGKSFWTFDLVMHIALGWEYRGHRVQQGTVVYLAMEGGTRFAGRIEAWRRRHLHDQPATDAPFYLINVALVLVQDHAEVIASIRQQLGAERPTTIVLDTLNRSLRGDENSSADMAEYIRAADALRAAFDCLVIIIHHCGTAGNRPRGHTSLSGADDVQIAIERDKEDNIVATVEHAKDSESGTVITGRLERIELGEDDEGDPMTSCVIVPAETVVKGPKLTMGQRFAVDLLDRLMKTNSVEAPADAHLPPGSRVVLTSTWREEFMVSYPTDNRDSRKRMFNKGVPGLAEKHLVTFWREFVWPGLTGTQ
jgi:hypothetical protein